MEQPYLKISLLGGLHEISQSAILIPNYLCSLLISGVVIIMYHEEEIIEAWNCLQVQKMSQENDWNQIASSDRWEAVEYRTLEWHDRTRMILKPRSWPCTHASLSI